MRGAAQLSPELYSKSDEAESQLQLLPIFAANPDGKGDEVVDGNRYENFGNLGESPIFESAKFHSVFQEGDGYDAGAVSGEVAHRD